MTSQSEILLNKAKEYCAELSGHEVLKKYWSDVSLVLKGSTARGNADRYSDIDFVFYCSENIRRAIIDDYFEKGLISGRDGVFIPLPDWIGHYNVDSFEKLDKYFDQRNYPQIWEYSNVVIMHDPSGRYGSMLARWKNDLEITLMRDVKNKYIDLQLYLDWLTHPLIRGDKVAVLLHGSRIVKTLCEFSYLLDLKAYPHEKWLFHYLDDTRFGKANKQLILEYSGVIAGEGPIERDMSLESYVQFAKAAKLTKAVVDFIVEAYGRQPWIEEWYLSISC